MGVGRVVQGLSPLATICRPSAAQERLNSAGERMAKRTRPKPWVFAVGFALAVFAVVSVLPVWTVWWFSDWEATGERATWWEMVWSVPRALSQAPDQFWSDFYGPQLVWT